MKFAVCLIATLLIAPLARAETITVSAAISMKESLQEIGKAFEAQSVHHVSFNFDASGKLGQQIIEGAPVDAFISADDVQVDKLLKANVADKTARRIVARNSLVLIVPANQPRPVSGFAGLANGTGKIAIGDPRSVPAGRYAQQVFSALKITNAVTPRLVLGENVRQVMTYVQRGEVDAGIVYSTDARQAGDQVKVIATADPATHEAIEYPAVVITGCAHAAVSGQFLNYLASTSARAILARHGFAPPASTLSTTQP